VILSWCYSGVTGNTRTKETGKLPVREGRSVEQVQGLKKLKGSKKVKLKKLKGLTNKLKG
jgi:hypothetical protein